MGLNLSSVELVQVVATLIKIVFVVLLCVQIPAIMVWVERRGPAFMQRRKGPNRVGLFNFRLWGLLQSFADAVKLIFKEEVVPTAAYKKIFHLAPMLGVIPAFLIAAAIPYGPDIKIGEHLITLNVINLDVGFLFILAISSLSVYSISLAGWASNNKYSLMGSLRSSAQMISYEIPMGLSLIPIVLIYGSLNLPEIVSGQGHLYTWGIFLAPLSFLVYFICMFAETNRAPFDLAESEAELVAGFHTEYGSTKFALFFMAEYVNMFVLSCLCSTLFFGGWQLPLISNAEIIEFFARFTPEWASLFAGLVGLGTLLVKAAFFMWMFVWVRWTLPRFRYDQLMGLGWKFLLPLGVFNIAVTALVIAFIKF